QMRKLIQFFMVAGLAVALSASAQAGALGSGSFSFSLATLPGITGGGSGPGSSAGGAGSVITLGGTPFGTGLTLVTLAGTAAAPLSALKATLIAPTGCTFSAGGGGGGGFGGACGMGGTINALVGTAPFLIVPASPLGGAARLGFGPYGSYIDPQVWTTGVAFNTINGVIMTTGNVTSPGGPIAMISGYDNRTAGGGGTIHLVAPAGLMSTLGGPFPLFVSMTLNFVPEPGTLLLLGSGILGLGLLGRKKQKNA
ncbi:MAG: PEP-CTERM sorting domain-containing protein, partial [Deltaproteobacteria bacterium]|nr:PEP-CTERM sorting domain-containing protein [Deltaproteobacteria bacterium]